MYVRLGKLNPIYFHDGPHANPYSIHDKVPLYEKLLPSLSMLESRMMKFASKCVRPDEAVDILKEIYTAPGLHPFLWYLNTLEIFCEGGGFYKYYGIVDIDLDGHVDLAQVYFRLQREMEQHKDNAVCWWTGKKGFRILFFPTLENPMLAENGKNIEPPKLHDEVLQRLVDKSIYIKGHGVKFDLLYHPATKKIPMLINPYQVEPLDSVMILRREYIHGGLLEFNTTIFFHSLATIAKHWYKLFTMLGGIIETLPKPQSKPPPPAPLLGSLDTQQAGRTLDSGFITVDLREWGLPREPTLPWFNGVMEILSYMKPSEDILVINCSHTLPHCPVHKKQHSRGHRVKNYIVLKRGAPYASLRCHASGALQELRLDMPLPSQPEPPPQPPASVGGFTTTTLETITPHLTTIHQDFIGGLLVEDPVLKDLNILLLRSPMGSGKTVGITKLIQPDSRVLVISTRRTCMMMLASMFSVAKYIDSGMVRNDLHLLDKVVVSMESLHRICLPNAPTAITRGYDVIILDECESIFANFNSATMLHRRANYSLLLQLILYPGTKTIFSDAFLGECTMQFFLRGVLAQAPLLQWGVVVNTRNQASISYELYPNESAGLFLKDFKVDCLKKRFIFACDRIDLIVFFQTIMVEEAKKAQCETPKTLIITAGSPREVIEASANCVSWEQYDCVFYSPAVTVGNSYSPQDESRIFDVFYGVFTGNTSTLESIQMTGRARKLKGGVVRVLLAAPSVSSGDAEILLGADYMESANVSRYIEDRIQKAQGDLKQLVLSERARSVARRISETYQDSTVSDDSRIVILPATTQLESIRIDPPLSHLEAIFTINVVNSRKSRFIQESQWCMFLEMTGLKYRVIERTLNSNASSLLSVVRNKKKEYLEKRRVNGDPYLSEIFYPEVSVAPNRTLIDTTVDGLNLHHVRTLLGDHISPELSKALKDIETMGTGPTSSIFNWDRLSEFINSHVSCSVWDRFYLFDRNVGRPCSILKTSELRGSVFLRASEFYGKGSTVIAHYKPFFDAFITYLLLKSDDVFRPDYIEEKLFLNVTAFVLDSPNLAYRIASEYFSNTDAFKEASVFYDTYREFSNKEAIKLLTTQPTIEDAIKNWKGKGKFEGALMKLYRQIFCGAISGLFGEFFEKVSIRKQKELLPRCPSRRGTYHMTRLRFNYARYWNSRELALFVLEDSKQISPEYPFHDYIQ